MPASLLNSRRWSLPVALSAVMAGFVGQAAEGGFVAGNLVVNNGYSTLNGYNLVGPQMFNGLGYGIATRFQVASTTAFDAAELALAYRTGTNAINVAIMGDQGGVPSGTALETMRVTGIGATPQLVMVNSTTHSTLAAGTTYWLVANYGAPDTNIAWFFNSTSQAGDSAYRVDTSSAVGHWVADPLNLDPGFAIFGSNAIPASGNAAVDGPPSIVLVAIGSLGLLGGHYHRRKRAAAAA